MRIKHHIVEAHRRWRDWLAPGDLALDATCGKGRDTAALLRMGAEVVALDIQPQARVQGVEWHLRCHSELDKVLAGRRARLVVYNLGYLPGGDKSVTTLTATTLASVSAALRCADAISITCYPGHLEGYREAKALSSLAPEGWHVEQLRWEARPTAPFLIWLEALAGRRDHREAEPPPKSALPS